MSSENNKRIAKNTLLLYFRQILILLVSLYTVRLVLSTLGVEDYGIYNVVAGIVSFFSFLSSAMASATQRFFAFALGERDSDKLNKTFTSNLLIYIGIALLSFLLLETVGLWFVNGQLHIPPHRFEAAHYVYQFSVFIFVSTIVSTPFIAIVIAHEDMQIFAYMSIVEAILKLTVVFLLVHLPWEKLELYGMLLFVVSTFVTMTYVFICVKKYQECQFRVFHWDKKLLHEIIDFTGWTLFGHITSVGRNQAVTILLNQFFNPGVVAARAIAVNVTGQINTFSNNFNTGLYPPIIKSYAARDKKQMFSLVFDGSKVTFFLMWVFALPLYLEMDIILKLWLNEPPEYAVLFTRLALIEVLINSLSLPITTAARAPGKMKVYELTLGFIQICIFAISWIVLRMGENASSVFIIAIVANIVMFVIRLLIVKSLLGLIVRSFLTHVALPVLLVMIFSVVPSFIVQYLLPKTILSSFLTIFLSILFCSASMYLFGLDKKLREKVNGFIMKRISNVLNLR